jgi:tetratricopeptide (TPR) repeat protein
MRRVFALLLTILLITLTGVADEGHDHHAGQTAAQLGKVHFPTTCSKGVRAEFERGVAILHSFWYEEAQKTFEDVAAKSPSCAMAHWGIAMSVYHPLWGATPPSALQRGREEMAAAAKLKASPRERSYIHAIGEFYKDSETVPHRARFIAYQSAMERLHAQNPQDDEAAIFYALSLLETGQPTEASLANNRKAGEILKAEFAKNPQHPGVAHYMIHAYDNPAMAPEGLEAARRYARIAPSVPHAQHMPSHIFTRLGLWPDAVASNSAAEKAAHTYEESSHLNGVWDQRMHPLDYLEYAYLQMGDDEHAKAIVDEVAKLKPMTPELQASAYAFAAIPARYYFETRNFRAAKDLPARSSPFPEFDAIIYLARTVADADVDDVTGARAEIAKMNEIHDKVTRRGDAYAADQVQIMILEAAAWTDFADNKNDQALESLRKAAAMEDATDKLPVSPGNLLPAREMLGDMLRAQGRPAEALKEYEASMKITPNRFNGIYGAAKAAQAAHDEEKAKLYFGKLLELAGSSQRRAVADARAYVSRSGD